MHVETFTPYRHLDYKLETFCECAHDKYRYTVHINIFI